MDADRRRADVRRARLNGVDGVEADDDGVTLTVTFLGKAPEDLGPENIRIDGGRRVTGITAVEVELRLEDDPELDDYMIVTVDRTGDTSTYTLSVVEADARGHPGAIPYEGFDPRYARADFTFHAGGPTRQDCAAPAPGPPAARPEPVIDYTARDYAGLRRLLLDRMTLTVPEWRERHVPDLGLTLVELFAYLGDQAAYHQDAVAAEAYLDTARRRISVRRHVRLIDYAMHDGCNARAFVTLSTDRRLTLEAQDFRFAAIDLSRADPRTRPGLGPVISEADLAGLPAGATAEVFEPVEAGPFTLHPAHNRIAFWTWGEQECHLPAGATSATLRDAWERCAKSAEGAEPAPPPDEAEANGPAGPGGDGGDGTTDPGGTSGDGDAGGSRGAGTGTGGWRRRVLRLRPGDVIILEEVLGPRTGAPADADPGHRQAVRLTSVTPGADALYGQPVTEVTWADEDALAFPVCISTHGGPDCAPLADVSVARGNVLLVDHGRDLIHCGGARERIPVPPAPVTAPSCAPAEFGCGDRPRPGRVVAEIHRLLVAAREGDPISGAELATLRQVVGAAAVERAHLRDGDPAARQAAALETLLAQLTYPPVTRRFTPALAAGPVTQRTPFPDPVRVAAGQAALLAAIPGRIRARLEELARAAGAHRLGRRRRRRAGSDGPYEGRRLSRREIDELRVIFGQEVIDGLDVKDHPARALRELLARFDELLAGTFARLSSLRDRAGEGEVLDGGIGWEVAQSLGPAYAEGLDPDDPRLAGPAAAALTQDVRAALPALDIRAVAASGTGDQVASTDHGDQAGGLDRPASAGRSGAATTGHERRDSERERHQEMVVVPRRDLLASGPRDRHVVGELDDDGRLLLRFGDGRHGAPPPPGGLLEVGYRVGNGAAGNVGSEAIAHLVLCKAVRGGAGAVTAVRNPSPATGGVDPEPADQVRRLAPLAPRRTRMRAVTAADYAELAGQVPGVQRAAAEIRWTGSGAEAHVAVDALARRGTAGRPDAALLGAVRHELEQRRRIGHDLVVGPAVAVPLDVELVVCVAAGFQQGHVLDALHRVLGAGRLPGGGLGLFHPDALTFGEPVRVSRIVATAAAVPGVLSVQVTRLRRLFRTDAGELADGLLPIGPLEIAQLDDDPDQPENGRLVIRLGGGR